jgi:hypothetical protein
VATVADGVLRDDLRALGVPVLGDVAPPPPEPGRTPARPKLALVLIGEAHELEAALGKALAGRGWQVLVAEPSDVPIDDIEAARRAAKAGGGAALVVSLAVADGGLVRGTRLRGAELQLAWRLVEVGAQDWVRLSDDAFAEAATGADPAAARRAVLAGAAETCARDAAFVAAQRWPAPTRKAAGTLVWLRQVSRFAEVGEAQRLLAKAPGVKKVQVFSLGPRHVYLLVQGGAPQDLGSALGALRVQSLQVREGMIDVVLVPQGAPEFTDDAAALP